MSKWVRHEANRLPQLSDAALEELANDISDNGMHQPVMMCEGKVLDGWNRVMANQLLDIPEDEVWTEEWQGTTDMPTLLRYVMSTDMRRHLPAADRARIILEYNDRIREAEAGSNDPTIRYGSNDPIDDLPWGGSNDPVEGGSNDPLTIDEVAETAGVSRSTVTREKRRMREEAEGAEPAPKPPSATERLNARIAELEAELAEVREARDDMVAMNEDLVARELSETEQTQEIERLRAQNRTLKSQLNQKQNDLNSWKREAIGWRKKNGGD